MRNATWRAHVITPGPGAVCNATVLKSLAPARDFSTIRPTSGPAGIKAPSRANVSLLAPSVSASMLAQFISLTVTPGGLGVPGPLRFSLSTHTLEHLPSETLGGCTY